MSIFKRKKDTDPAQAPEAGVEAEATDTPAEVAGSGSADPRAEGPWDVAEVGKKILESVDQWPRGLTFQDLT